MERKRILLADDEPKQIEHLLRILQIVGIRDAYTIDTASHMREALSLLKEHASEYALIISDNNMEYANQGLELKLVLNEGGFGVSTAAKDTPFILNTSDNSDEIKHKIAEYGGHHCYKFNMVDVLPNLIRSLLSLESRPA